MPKRSLPSKVSKTGAEPKMKIEGPRTRLRMKGARPRVKIQSTKSTENITSQRVVYFWFFLRFVFLFFCVNVKSNRITCKRIWIESGWKHKEIFRQKLLNIFNQLMEAWFCNAYLKIVKTYNMWFSIAWLTHDILALSSPLRQCACRESSPGHKHGRLVWCRYTTCALLQRFSGCV